jgi:phenylpyruvate tautomerase PptA (4-oxalocrotonate tautomerase family)
MPILHVRSLPQKDPSQAKRALKVSALAIAEAYGCGPEQVWVTWQELDAGHYVEGENGVDVQPVSTHPPICELIVFEGKSPEVLEKVLLAAASSLSGALGIPGNIFIHLIEARSGRVIAGDGIVRRS